MGIFSGLFKSRDKPQNRTAGSNYAFFFGGTTSGKAVTERSAMQMTAVYSCVRILSEAVAGLPLHLYKYTDSGGKAKENPMPPTTEQAVIMLSSHFYESRDGSTGGFFADNTGAAQQVWNTVNLLLRLDRRWQV